MVSFILGGVAPVLIVELRPVRPGAIGRSAPNILTVLQHGLGMILAFVIFGCAEDFSSSTKMPKDTPPLPNQTAEQTPISPLVGDWKTESPCTTTFAFNNDLTFESKSNLAVVSGTYVAEINTETNYTVELNILENNGFPTCGGGPNPAQPGESGSLRIEFGDSSSSFRFLDFETDTYYFKVSAP